MRELRVVTLCRYLTEIDCAWRPGDYTAMKIVKAVKGEPINGYFELRINGRLRTFDQDNIDQFKALLPSRLRKAILDRITGKATLIPIPHSHITRPDDPSFRMLQVAEEIARGSEGRLEVVPALVFRTKQVPSHRGGPRSPFHFERAYRLTQRVAGPVVLLDDVVTTGGYLIGACWKLAEIGADVALACALGKSTKVQDSDPLGSEEYTLDLARTVPDFDDF